MASMTSALDRGDEFDSAVEHQHPPPTLASSSLASGRCSQGLLVERPTGFEIANGHHDSVHTLLFHRSTPRRT